MFIPRQRLRISDRTAAGEFIAVGIRTEIDGDAMKVTLSIINDDLSNRESSTYKPEREVGSYLIRAGETLRAAELDQFGIEPLEMRVISSKTVVFKRGEGPRISNNTTALELARLEKHSTTYRLWLKNTSARNVVAYTISAGRSSVGVEGDWSGDTRAVIPAGATTDDGISLDVSEVESSGITIQVAVFEDGSFEGDSKLGGRFLAKIEGLRIQSPYVLRRIEETLLVDDPGLRAAYDKLEAELWEIPEAMDKPSATEFLKVKFLSLDEKTISTLYEEFKGGFYDARNIALSSLGTSRQFLKDRAQYDNSASTAKALRGTLENLKQILETINSVQR
ncbi:MAG: hypothetical protein AABO41_23225 [Acidobacteriota bacterium]